MNGSELYGIVWIDRDLLNLSIDNYDVLLDLWIKACDSVRDTEMKARIQGVVSQMNTF